MDSNTVIKVEGLYKKFSRSIRRSMALGTIDLARNFIGFPTNQSKLRKSEFWALKNVNFEVKRGETFGIMGRNGSGKSTLLRIINGIFPPDRGQVTIRDKMGALIAVGAGFHPHMTGRENVYLNGTILGMTNAEIKREIDDIVEFADIADFIDAPVATYSSGMRVRLGFSIAIHAEVEILLVDEILSVGDVNFRKKSFERILEMRRSGVSTLFVSHSLGQLQRLCKRGLLLEKGEQVYIGPIRECIKRYTEILNEENLQDTKIGKFGSIQETVGVGNVVISDAKSYAKGSSNKGNRIVTGKDVIVEFNYEFREKERDDYQVRLGLRSAEGALVQKFLFQEKPYLDTTKYVNDKFVQLKDKGTVKITINDAQLFPQVYVVDIAIISTKMNVHEGGVSSAAEFEIIDPPNGNYHHEYDSSSITNFNFEVQTE